MPRMKKLYDEYHAKGFEIVGVSLDQDQSNLEDYVKAKEIPWPQAFDGKGWESDLAVKFGVNSIPAMWLVNKRGLVVSTDAREMIEKDLPALLAE
jgi:peroxiredoxin